MVYAVILAGGLGTRMKSSRLPKQFLTLGKETILSLTVDKFLVCPKIDHVIVAAPSIWISHTRDLLKESRFANVKICEGGVTRQESLYFALKFIEKEFVISDSDIIVSHDVSRPFISLRIIEENIQMLDRFDACDTVISATDTIVMSKDGIKLDKIPNRSIMYRGQTPQSFRRVHYKQAYENLDAEYLENVSDAARILLEQGYSVGIVYGDESNIKITNEFDFKIANFLVNDGNDKASNPAR